MPITDKLPVVLELERVFGILNRQMFGGRLKVPTITVQIEKKVVFRFTPESYHMLIGSKFATVTIRGLEEHLLHEMTHISNHTDGVVDCTSNQYHNKRFLTAALEAGMYVMRHKTQGWGVTKFDITAKESENGVMTPKPKSLGKRERVFGGISFDRKIVTAAQRRMKKKLDENAARKICFLKYVCKCRKPHNSIRSGRRPDGDHPLKIHCNVCNSDFRLATGQVERK